ncbi:hypothetical protein [Actinoplanes sp. NPDC026623]
MFTDGADVEEVIALDGLHDLLRNALEPKTTLPPDNFFEAQLTP